MCVCVCVCVCVCRGGGEGGAGGGYVSFGGTLACVCVCVCLCVCVFVCMKGVGGGGGGGGTLVALGRAVEVVLEVKQRARRGGGEIGPQLLTLGKRNVEHHQLGVDHLKGAMPGAQRPRQAFGRQGIRRRVLHPAAQAAPPSERRRGGRNVLLKLKGCHPHPRGHWRDRRHEPRASTEACSQVQYLHGCV